MTRDTASSLVSGRGRKLEHIRREGILEACFPTSPKANYQVHFLERIEGVEDRVSFEFPG